MKKRLYRKILKTLRKFFGKRLKGHKKRRLKKLAAFICGLMRSKRPDMRSIGTGLIQKIKAYSKEKEAKKFVDNLWIDSGTYYRPFISQVLAKIIELFPEVANATLVVDGSKMGKGHMALMVSLFFKGRGLPLVWTVKKKPKGHFKAQDHVDILNEAHRLLKPILPPSAPVTVLGDGEFDSIKLQECCLSFGWEYVFRTACDTVLYEDGSRFQPKDIQVDPNHGFQSIPDVEFTEERMRHVHFVLWHDPKYEDPIPLVSNMEEPIDIIQAYDKRYSIECMFKDMKSTTFNIHKTRLRNEHAISNLIMIAAFALVLFVKIGVKYKNSPLREYIHRVRDDQKIYSLITYARDFVKYCLEEKEKFSFSFSFQISKNTS